MTSTAGKRRTRRDGTARTPLLPFKASHGGRREGAGRKPKHGQAGVDHRPRAALASRHPVLVTVKLRPHLPRLRQRAEYAALRTAFARGKERNLAGPFRLCHYVVLNDHLHFVVEAANRTALARGLQGLLIRVAKTLNKLWGRRGRVFGDRYHDRVLRSPREVRHALRYVLGNGRKHAAAGREVSVPQAVDTFSSAPWFDGFRERVSVRALETIIRPIAAPHTWLLRVGWRRHGLLGVDEVPKTG